MSKPNRLSHSAVSKFQQCGKAYDFHYNHRLRPKYQSAALFFGSAVDAAINSLLKKEKKDPYEVFDYNWRFGRVDGQEKKEYLPDSQKIVYSNSDYDKELLKDDDYKELYKITSLNIKDDVNELYKTLSETKKTLSWNGLSEDDKKLFNLFNWMSLRRKGHLMIDAYKIQIMPNIIKVLDVQKYIKLKNDEGDEIIGYIDLIAEWKNEGNVIFDLKTSSIEYDESAVLTNPQLTLYKNAVGKQYQTNKAGFLVLRKQVDKNRIKMCSKCNFNGSGSRHKTCPNDINGVRCNGEYIESINPKVNVQILIDKIPDQTEKIVMENYQQINDSIKAGHYVRNFASCDMPWGPCPYKGLCFKNDDSDLIKLESKKKKGD